ncbi:FxsA family protein [Terasakiella sp. SH-1]|uniref:FxsA family protein n=1 Tax=Terasakiella sp. SH-1 TaxID=2560057 RepID=UPI00107362B2|nr:FxsA family protein [Terasakiella sp. SH-1]
MGFFILLLFIAVPVTEIAVFIQVGDIIGLWPTIAIVILTAILGTALLRQQGMNTLMRAQATLNTGHLPTAELFDGACLLFAGALLLTPGFVTDTVGFLLFFPPFRAFLRHKAKDLVKNSSNIHMMGPDGRPFEPHPPHSQPHQGANSSVIDGEFEEVKANPESPWSEKQD